MFSIINGLARELEGVSIPLGVDKRSSLFSKFQ